MARDSKISLPTEPTCSTISVFSLNSAKVSLASLACTGLASRPGHRVEKRPGLEAKPVHAREARLTFAEFRENTDIVLQVGSVGKLIFESLATAIMRPGLEASTGSEVWCMLSAQGHT